MTRFFLLYAAALAAFVLLASGCCGALAVGDTAGVVRAPAQQKACAVRLIVRCKAKNLASTGSGVIVSKTEILTATHVIEWCDAPEVIATPPRGFGRRMRVSMVSTLTDVARMRIADDGEFGDVAPPKIGPVSDGSRICAALADPYQQRRCGFIEDQRSDMRNDLIFSAPIEPGNSGSGLYDSRGRLIGIVTAKTEHGRGIATSLAGREWLLDMAVTR